MQETAEDLGTYRLWGWRVVLTCIEHTNDGFSPTLKATL